MSQPDETGVFEEHSTCTKYLVEKLGLGTDSLDSKLKAAFVDACEEEGHEQEGYELSLGRWVVKFEDIGVFSAIRNAFISLGTVGYAFGNLEEGGVAAVIFATTEIATNLFRSTGSLSTRQVRIIAIMRAEGSPVSAAKIARQPTAEGDLEWTEETIEAELKAMQTVLIRKGSMKIVDCLPGPEVRWFLNGV